MALAPGHWRKLLLSKSRGQGAGFPATVDDIHYLILGGEEEVGVESEVDEVRIQN